MDIRRWWKLGNEYGVSIGLPFIESPRPGIKRIRALVRSIILGFPVILKRLGLDRVRRVLLIVLRDFNINSVLVEFISALAHVI